MNKQPKIALVGAGPGDPDLLTIKGQKAIQQADVILYDALVNEIILDLAPTAKKIFVGKRRGVKAFSQDQINRLMVQEAIENGNVVRLKGGDSFVFGRGYEELEFAHLFGIPVEVVPGISSSISVPALAGIPVTHRGASNGFYVLTAVLSDGSLNPEIKQAAQTNATVVILMGLNKLTEIATIFSDSGKKNEAVAVISNGSLPNQRTVIGNIGNIVYRAAQEGIPAPAVIVVGEVVKQSEVVSSIKVQRFISQN
ncbi:MAG: uroporphyrinogen-III C-methyltransferase [Flavobacteriia bacterium]|nr:uroporphyrinogen-III C-methyltransferase [Flavobacteriia bacterium]